MLFVSQISSTAIDGWAVAFGMERTEPNGITNAETEKMGPRWIAMLNKNWSDYIEKKMLTLHFTPVFPTTN